MECVKVILTEDEGILIFWEKAEGRGQSLYLQIRLH